MIYRALSVRTLNYPKVSFNVRPAHGLLYEERIGGKKSSAAASQWWLASFFLVCNIVICIQMKKKKRIGRIKKTIKKKRTIHTINLFSETLYTNCTYLGIFNITLISCKVIAGL